MKCGIYKITNLKTNMCYIGSSDQIERRWSQHKTYLNRKEHQNEHLQNAWNQDGESNFCFEILEECLKSDLLIREQYYLDTILKANTFDLDNGKLFYSLGYNLNPICNRPNFTKDIKSKISGTLKEKYKSGKIEKQGTKKVYQYNRYTGKLIKIWDSVNDANRHYKVSNLKHSPIHKVLWNQSKCAFNSFWSYTETNFVWISNCHGIACPIAVINNETKTYEFYDSIKQFLDFNHFFGSDPNYLKNKFLDKNKLYKNKFKLIKIAPIIYDGKPFELLGTRENLITKTEEEILNVNV